MQTDIILTQFQGKLLYYNMNKERVLVLMVLLWTMVAHAQVQTFQWGGFAQGTTYQITYFAEDAVVRKAEVDSLFEVIDESMSLYRPDARIVYFNKPETQSMLLDEHFIQVMTKAFDIHHQSQGRFDVTVGALTQFWSQPASSFVEEIEAKRRLDTLVSASGMKYLSLNGHQLIKLHPLVQVDLNGIAQGYTVDLIANFLEQKGIHNYVVELGGEIRVNGSKPNGNEFIIGIDTEREPIFLRLNSGAVTTSSRNSPLTNIPHHINPDTGRPVHTSAWKVTVIAPNAITADALDNVLMLWNENELETFINAFPYVEYLIIMEQNGEFRHIMSPGFSQYIKY